MKHSLREWVCFGLLGALLALGACGLRPALAEEPVPPPTPVPQPGPGPAPAPGAATEAQRLLQKQAEDEKKLREEIATQANAHYEAGKALFAAFDYEGARNELETAVRLDPTHEEARKLLTRVNDVLNVRNDRVRSAASQLFGEAKIQAQEKLVELDNRIDMGKRFIHDAQTDPELSLAERIRRYEQALAAFERARELIKFMPVDVNTDEQSNEVSRLVNDTRKAIQAAQVRLQETDREKAVQLVEEQRANERKFRERKLNMMVDQAKALFETGKYEEAQDLANKILEMDPVNAEAHTIIATARDRAHTKKESWIASEYKEQATSNREIADRMNIPHADYLIYPENWAEITQRSAQESGAHRVEEPWKSDIRKKLSRHVSFEFVDTPLEEAIQFLNTLSKINIIIDPKITAEGAQKTPITLRVQDMEMETALKWILRLAELEYDLRNQAVFITKKANLISNIELEIYDIRDLTTAITDFPGPRVDLGAQSAQAGGAVNPFDTAAQAPTLAPPDLQVLIKERLLPAEFADPQTSIEEQNGKLIVMQRPEVQDRIRALLRSFRETQTIQVLTQVRFVDVTEGFLEHIGVHFMGLDAAPGDRGVPNAAVFPNAQPSPSGLFPAGGGPGAPPPLPTDVQSSPNFQFANFIPRPPFQAATPVNGQLPITLLRPRLDPNFPNRGNATVGPANGPVGFRRQWFENVFNSPVLFQGLTQNLLRANPLSSTLGQSLQTSPQQGLMMQFRFLQSSQSSAILQALRKDETSDQLLAPKLMQFNNQRAHILVAQQRSYIGDYDVSGAVFDPVIKTLLVGIVMEVKPTVSNDKRYITMDVRPGTAVELTPPQIVFITNAGNDVNVGGGTINLPIELPNLEIRSVNTTVTVPDNGTMLFSGLITDRKMDSKSGIPVLSDLPLIGRFFCSNHKERVRRNLLVLINARIVLFDEEEARL
ncbi:MAG TPA: hypothetical protein VGP72_14880 [Planctomycetota bacterium]|jgi:type II secretory pathway component GspD/PulD (secretin)